jgi:hypothetical protein
MPRGYNIMSLARFRLSLLALFVLALLPTVSITAQEDALSEEAQGWLNDVQAAFDNMAALESVRIVIDQTIDQTIAAQNSISISQIHQAIDGAIDYTGDHPALELTMVQNAVIQSGAQTVEIPLTMDLVLLDESSYLRVREVSRDMIGMFPEGWGTPDQFPGVQVLDYDEYIRNINPGAQYPITPETVRTISQLEADTLDDLAMQVFDLEFDAEALVENEAYGQLSQLFANSSSEEMEETIKEIFRGASFKLRLWIGEADQLIYRAIMDVQIDAQLSGLIPGTDIVTHVQMTLHSQVDYHSFNEPVEIEVPELGE